MESQGQLIEHETYCRKCRMRLATENCLQGLGARGAMLKREEIKERCRELRVILPVLGSLMYCQESRSETFNYIGAIPAINAGMVTYPFV